MGYHIFMFMILVKSVNGQRNSRLMRRNSTGRIGVQLESDQQIQVGYNPISRKCLKSLLPTINDASVRRLRRQTDIKPPRSYCPATVASLPAVIGLQSSR